MKQRSVSENHLSPSMMILLGIVSIYALTEVFNFSFWGNFWTFFIIAPGLPFLYFAYNGGKNAAPLIIPGLIISGTGALIFVQNLTGHWESWAYAWTIYPMLVGLGLIFMGKRTGNRHEIDAGHTTLRGGLSLFVIFGAFFELLIFGGFGGSLWGPLFLAAGLFVYVKSRRSNDSYDAPLEVKSKRKRVIIDEPSAAITPELKRKIEEVLAGNDEDLPIV
jgi:hypothetical protein